MKITKYIQDSVAFIKLAVSIAAKAFAVAPLVFTGYQFVAIINAAAWVGTTWQTQRFFEAVTAAANSGSGTEAVVWSAALLVLVFILTQLINGLINYMANAFHLVAGGGFKQLVYGKIARLNRAVFEDKAALDTINKAENGAGSCVEMLMTAVILLTFYLPYCLLMFVYLYSLEPLLSVALLLIFLPVASAQLVRHKLFAGLEDEAAPLRREGEYWRNCAAGKETRTLGAFPRFFGLFATVQRLLAAAVWRAEKKAGFAELLTQSMTLLGYLAVIALFANAALNGRISVGAFAAAFASIELMFAVMNELFARQIGGLAQSAGAVRNFAEFLGLPERRGVAQHKTGYGISMRDVSFSYPGASMNSLDNINLDIADGETIAIVGENGAGKSTLVKVALGIYEPSSGVVLQSGLDSRAADNASLFTGVSAVFQDFQRYKMSLQDNITVSVPESATAPVDVALEQAGIPPDNAVFPDGIATMLSREFDGVELSGGQWQRLAIARGLYRSHDIIVLDEPTAAIDPLEETSLYRKFAAIAAGKTAIIVTHRLGSARIADRIVVLDSGRIVETGSHDELMAHNGKYAALYAAQAKWYERRK